MYCLATIAAGCIVYKHAAKNRTAEISPSGIAASSIIT